MRLLSLQVGTDGFFDDCLYRPLQRSVLISWQEDTSSCCQLRVHQLWQGPMIVLSGLFTTYLELSTIIIWSCLTKEFLPEARNILFCLCIYLGRLFSRTHYYYYYYNIKYFTTFITTEGVQTQLYIKQIKFFLGSEGVQLLNNYIPTLYKY